MVLNLNTRRVEFLRCAVKGMSRYFFLADVANKIVAVVGPVESTAVKKKNTLIINLANVSHRTRISPRISFNKNPLNAS